MFTALKVFTTILVLSMMLIVWYFMNGQSMKDKATVVGFSFMEIVYLLSLICIWG